MPSALEANAHSVAESWPFSDAQMVEHLASAYRSELVDAGRKAGIEIGGLDDRLTAFPVVIQILPAARAIAINGKRSAALRPSQVIERIKAQRKAAGARP